MRSPLSLSSGKLRKRKKSMLVSLNKSSSCMFICLLKMLSYQTSEESSLSSCHLVTKATREIDKVSFLKKILVSLRVVTCVFKKTSL